MIGTVLSNRYKLIAELGSGGMAWVYLAQDLVQGRRVAVKILYPQHSQDLGFVQRFNREAKLSMTLSRSSPQRNVVQVLDYGADRDTHYLVMEYVPGKDLGQILAEEGPLPWPRALDIARQVAEALNHAARLDIVHRDIKPSNIMVCPDATVKVLDFGIARARSSPHVTLSGFVGSPHYAAPEQATGQPVDIRADIYSLGVVLYRMLSGDLPFQGDTPWAVVNQHILAEPPELAEKRPDLPVPVLRLVQRAMTKRAEDRFQTPAEFVAALDAISAGQERPLDPLPGQATLPLPELEALYRQALRAVEAERWQQAIDLLSQIVKVDPGYADVAEQLDKAGVQIQLLNLYRAAYRALESGEWDRALTQIDRIAEIDPSYKDIAALRLMATRKEKPPSLGPGLEASPASEFPTQIPQQRPQPDSELDIAPAAPPSPSAPFLGVSSVVLRRRLPWIAALLGALLLAALAYLLFARPQRSGNLSQDLSGGTTQSIPPTTVSSPSQASAMPATTSPTPSSMSVAGTPSATTSPAADLPATTTHPHTPSPSPPPALSPTYTSLPDVTLAPTPHLALTPTATLTPTPTPTLPLSPMPAPALRRAPTGVIAFPRFDSARGTYDVLACRVDGTDCKRIQEQASQPDFLPAGIQLVVHSWRPEEKGLVVLTVGGQRIWQITTQLEAARPSVDYLGERYVYHSRDESDRQPRLFRTYNAETRPIVREGSAVVGQSPSWTPDRQILYSGCLANNCGIILMRADGSSPRQIVPGGSEANPEASPDGQRIVFMSRRDGNWEVYVAAIDGGNLRRLTQNPGNDGLPTWSPDGRYVAFITDRDGPWAVWVMRPDGREQRKLFDLGGPLDGQVQGTALHELHGWVEERISWAP